MGRWMDDTPASNAIWEEHSFCWRYLNFGLDTTIFSIRSGVLYILYTFMGEMEFVRGLRWREICFWVDRKLARRIEKVVLGTFRYM